MQLAGRHRRHRPSARIWPRGPLSRRRCSGLAAPRSRRPRRLERFKRHLNGTYAYFEDRDGRGNLLAVLPLSPVPCGAVDNHAACGGRLLAVQTLRRARAQNPQDQQVQDRLLPYRRAATRPVIPQDLDREQSARRSRRSSARRHLQPETRPSHWPCTRTSPTSCRVPAKKKLYGPPSKEKVEKAKHRRLALLSKEANALLEEISPSTNQAPQAAYVEVEPGVFMVGVEAIEGAAAGAPSVAFTPM